MVKKVFISYSWSKQETVDYVIELAKKLSGYGEVKIILDRIDLKPGHDMNYFMETSVKEADKVLIICDKSYREKANLRERGAGIETQIISPQVYKSVTQTKFMPIYIDSEENAPTYLSGRLGVRVDNYDLSEEKIIEIMKRILEIEEIELPKIKKSFLEEYKEIKVPRKKINFQNVILSPLSIKTLVGYITGDLKKSPYRSGPQLIKLFNSFGKRDVYSFSDGGLPGGLSRKQFVEKNLKDFNDTEELKGIIERIVDNREYTAGEFNLEDVVNGINLILVHDGYKLQRERGIYKLIINK